MKKLLLSGIAVLALCSTADAQNAYAISSCGSCYVGTGTVTVCCTATPDEATLASWAARKAVESQQSTWWETKKVKDLSREELDARTKKLAALKVWAKALSNHIFAAAYCDWADARLSELAARRKSLDQLDVALSLVKGLPTPPETK